MFISIISLFATIVCLIYAYYIHCHGYWRRHSIPYIPGKFPFGSITSVLLRKQSFMNRIQEIYTSMKSKGHKYVGLYFFTRKALLILDPELVKKVLTIDFQYFHDRGIYYDEKNDPLSAHLVALSGDKWRELRQKLSPTFSPGKLKTMFATVLKCAQQLTHTLKQENKDGPFEMKEFAARYTTDVIGSCAFGIECNSLKNPNAEFRQIGKKVFENRIVDVLKRLVIRNAPWLARKLKIKVINREVSKFFIGIVNETVAYRRKENISRGDFLQLLMELMDKRNEDLNEIEKGRVKFDGKKDADAQTERNRDLTVNEAAAHSFVFFLAGYETSASTITFALYELSRHTYIQDKVRAEVCEVVKKYSKSNVDGDVDVDGVTYEAIMDMHYMDRVLLETMRKYPTFILLMRKCTRDYNLSVTDENCSIKLQKGIPVIIPVHALHHDTEYYPDPDQFNPDRFKPETSQSRIDHTYLPFGNGPRICIGLRFAMIQMKVALAMMLLHFKFKMNDKTEVPMTFNPNSFILTPLNGTWLDFEELPTST